MFPLPFPPPLQELWTQLSDVKWVRHVFPEFHPTGRAQALMLGDTMAAMLDDYARRAQGMSALEAVAAAKEIHSNCFLEILRQVSVQCIERGNVLKAVWRCVAVCCFCCVCLGVYVFCVCVLYMCVCDTLI